MNYSHTRKITEALLNNTEITKEYIIKHSIHCLIDEIPLEKLSEIFDIDWVDKDVAKERYWSTGNSFWAGEAIQLENNHIIKLIVELK